MFWFVLLGFLSLCFLCFFNILEFVCYCYMFKRMIWLETFCCDFTIISIHLVILSCLICLLSLLFSFEIIAYTLRIYVLLFPFNIIFSFYCVMWHGFFVVMYCFVVSFIILLSFIIFWFLVFCCLDFFRHSVVLWFVSCLICHHVLLYFVVII